MKLQSSKYKMKNFKQPGKESLSSKECPSTIDFTTMAAVKPDNRTTNDTINVLKKINCQPKSLCTGKVSFKNESELKTFLKQNNKNKT